MLINCPARAPLRDDASLFLEIEHAAGQLRRDSDA